MFLRRIWAIMLCIVLCIGILAGCSGENNNGTVGGLDWLEGLGQTDSSEPEDLGELVILYTNDVHNVYDRNQNTGSLGYGALAAYREELEEKDQTVILIDGGDAMQGSTAGILSQGAYMVDIMNEAGYVFAVPGNHDFDFGVENLLKLADEVAEFSFLCCNFVDLSTGKAVFAPYVIEEYNGVQVAFIGITTPETVLTEPDSGRYGFCGGNDGQDLYDRVQLAIDEARKEGAEHVIAIGHLGSANTCGWSSLDVISNTTGLDAFLDGHSHTPGAGIQLHDKDNRPVAYCANADQFTSFGEIRLSLGNGVEETNLVTDFDRQDLNMVDFLKDITSQLDTLMEKVIARSEVELLPGDEDGNRLVRKQETALGNLCADAYRAALDADAAFVYGGCIRGGLPKGEVTYADLLNILPQEDHLYLVQMTGQQIMDTLEMAYRAAGESEFGGFLQVSGLDCQVDTTIASPVKLDEEDMFQGISGTRRVGNVTIGGKAIDAQKTYTVAVGGYLAKQHGSGFSMFSRCKVLQDRVTIDDQALVDYVQQTLGGVIRSTDYGQAEKRIRMK